MFRHAPLLARAAGLMGQLLDLVDFPTLGQRYYPFFGPEVDVAAVSQVFDSQRYSQPSPVEATLYRRHIDFIYDDSLSLSEGGSITRSSSSPDGDTNTATLSAFTPSIERPTSYGLNPSPAELVWSNDLCMSEIYGHMGRGTLVKCLVLSKDNVERVAKELYRSMERRDLTDMFESGSDFNRLGTAMHYIRTLKTTENEWSRYGIGIGSPLLQFPLLNTLELWDPDTRRFYEKYEIEPDLIIEERLATHLLLVHYRHLRYTSDPTFEMNISKVMTSSSSTLMAITIGDSTKGTLLIQSMVRYANVILAKRHAYRDSVLANLRTFTCKHYDPLEPDDLAVLLYACPRLVELFVYVKDSPPSRNKIGPLLSSMSGTLKIVHLHGAGIEWLSFLNRIYRVSLTCSTAPLNDCMHKPADNAPLSSSQEPALQHLTLQVERYLTQRDISYAARYLDAFISNSTELVLLPGIAGDILRDPIEKLRSTVDHIRKKKTNRCREGPGFRLIEPAAHPLVNSER